MKATFYIGVCCLGFTAMSLPCLRGDNEQTSSKGNTSTKHDAKPVEPPGNNVEKLNTSTTQDASHNQVLTNTRSKKGAHYDALFLSGCLEIVLDRAPTDTPQQREGYRQTLEFYVQRAQSSFQVEKDLLPDSNRKAIAELILKAELVLRDKAILPPK